MSAWRSSWVLLVAIAVAAPGCLLVQPLDDLKSDSAGAGGQAASGNKAGSGGKANNGGSTSSAGKGGSSTSTGGKGGAPAAAGSPPSGVNFEYFVDTWTVTSGTISTDCGATGSQDTPATVGSTDTITVGTTSDLIVDEGTQCPILADVNDLVATGQPGQTCDFSDDSGAYHLKIESFDFIVSGDHATAQSDLKGQVTVTLNGVATTCASHQVLNYTH